MAEKEYVERINILHLWVSRVCTNLFFDRRMYIVQDVKEHA